MFCSALQSHTCVQRSRKKQSTMPFGTPHRSTTLGAAEGLLRAVALFHSILLLACTEVVSTGSRRRTRNRACSTAVCGSTHSTHPPGRQPRHRRSVEANWGERAYPAAVLASALRQARHAHCGDEQQVWAGGCGVVRAKEEVLTLTGCGCGWGKGEMRSHGRKESGSPMPAAPAGNQQAARHPVLRAAGHPAASLTAASLMLTLQRTRANAIAGGPLWPRRDAGGDDRATSCCTHGG